MHSIKWRRYLANSSTVGLSLNMANKTGKTSQQFCGGEIWNQPVRPTIQGRQDFTYKTPILFFYSENNSDSLNRPPNANLIVVQ